MGCPEMLENGVWLKSAPPHVAVAANRILASGYVDQPPNRFLDGALDVIIALPEMKAHRRAAIYVREEPTASMRLAAHRHIDFSQIAPRIDLASGGADDMKSGARRSDRVFVPIQAGVSEASGVLVVFGPAESGAAIQIAEALRPLAEAVATVLQGKRAGAAHRQLTNIAEASPHEVYIFDPATLRVLRCNDAAERNSGYRASRITALTPVDLKADLDARTYRERIDPVLTGDAQHITFDVRQRRKDGTVYNATARVWRLRTEDGDALAELVVDRSDHHALADLLSAAIDSFPGGFCALDANLRLTMANRNLYELLDLPEERFPVGSHFEEIVRFYAERGEYGDADVEELVRLRMEHAKLFLAHNFERESANGTVLDVRVAPLPGGGCVLTYSDITERRRAQMELIRHRDDLERAVAERTAEIERQAQELQRALAHERRVNELQRQFVSMASHEFRTPLAIIDGAAQRLLRRRGELNQDYVHERAIQVRASVSRMVELMDSILAAGRLDEGKIEVKPSACSIKTILTACCARQNDLSRTHRITLEHGEAPEHIRADAAALDQVFTNLLSNAVKYSPGSPDIAVTARTEGSEIVIDVKDRGLGIDEDEMPKMFQRYFRARTSSGIAGTGIGLNLVQQIIQLHGGSIAVASRKGEGSTFTVRLPLWPTTAGMETGDIPDSAAAA